MLTTGMSFSCRETIFLKELVEFGVVSGVKAMQETSMLNLYYSAWAIDRPQKELFVYVVDETHDHVTRCCS